MVVKKFDGYLILNIKTGKIRYLKRFPTGISPYEIVNRLIIDIEMPEQNENPIEKTIVVKESTMKKIFMEEL